MHAIHINSTAPFFAKHKDGAYFIDKFDLYNAVISALQWRKVNGKISYVTDKTGADYLQKLGIAQVWDEVLPILDERQEGINPTMFWAAGKLLALREIPAPVAMVDTDFIVWEKLNLGDKIVAAHREDIMDGVYPPKEYFRFKKRPDIDGLDWSVLPLNTAFLYLPDEDFKQYYVNRAISFMKQAADCDDYLCYMVFAEQRLLSMCAQQLGRPVETLLEKDELFFMQNRFTHLWGAKQVLRRDLGAMSDFCTRARKRIMQDFPDYAYVVGRIEAAQIKL